MPIQVSMIQRVCAECGDNIPENENNHYYHLGDDTFFCSSSCLAEWDICYVCETPQALFNLRRVSVNGDRTYLCESCLEDYTRCDGCGDYVYNESIVCVGNSYFCESCSESYDTCNGCGCAVWHDDSYYHENDDEYYCSDCHHSHSTSGYIHSHEYKPSPIYHGEFPLYGIEVETDNYNDVRDASEELNDLDNTEYNFYQKYDGSLVNGIEIVFHPRSLTNWMNEGKKILEDMSSVCIQNGGRAYRTQTCGLHIHRSKRDLDTLTVSKILIFFARFSIPIIKLARRESDYASFYQIREDIQHKTLIYKKVRDGYSYSNRYQAVNLTNRRTIEFRVFRGTLKVTSILGCIDFVDSVIEFVKMHSIKYLIDKCSWDYFLNYSRSTGHGAFLAIWDSVKNRKNGGE